MPALERFLKVYPSSEGDIMINFLHVSCLTEDGDATLATIIGNGTVFIDAPLQTVMKDFKLAFSDGGSA